MKKIAVLGLLLLCGIRDASAGEGAVRRAREPVRGQYLVMLQNVAPRAVETAAKVLAHRFSGRIDHVFQAASTGFAISMTDAQATALAHDPMVRFVEEVSVVHLSTDQALPTNDSLYFLDRLDSTQDRHYDYCEKGADVITYLIDTGTWVDHAEFQTNGSSRVLPGNSFASDVLIKPGDSADYGYYPFDNTSNHNPCAWEHGTMTASILAGNTYGVAKNASIVPLRVFNCSFQTTSYYMNYAVDWIMSHYNPYRDHRPALLSMSVFQFVSDGCANGGGVVTQLQASYLENEIDALLGWGYSSSTGFYTPYIVQESGQANYAWYGIPVIASANNMNNDAGDTTPARMAYHNAANLSSGGHVISVGGLDTSDQRWVDTNRGIDACGNQIYLGSNYGPTVDVYASAQNITGAWATSNSATTATNYLSGTSFSAPIVAGLIARMQERYGAMLPVAAWNALQNSSVLPSTPIEPYGVNNKMIARMYGAYTCSPEYP